MHARRAMLELLFGSAVTRVTPVRLALAQVTPVPSPFPSTANPSGQTLAAWLEGVWPSVLLAAIVIIVAWLALRLGLNLLGRAMRRGRLDLGTQILIRRTITVAVVVLTILLVLGILGASPATLVALTGAVGLALSLAIQDILKNFFSGVYLLLERPFRVGDVISVKDQTGRVENVGIRTTTLRTIENVQVLVPNAIVFAEVVKNQTYAQPAEPSHPVDHTQVDSGAAPVVRGGA